MKEFLQLWELWEAFLGLSAALGRLALHIGISFWLTVVAIGCMMGRL